jgi:hypothetical protein
MRISKLLGGNRPPSAIINGVSSGGAVNSNMLIFANAKSIVSGAVTANVLAQALTVSGQGVVNLLAIVQSDTVSRAQRLKITIDGISVFDATGSVTTVSNSGLCAIGSSSSSTVAFDQVYFNSGFTVEFSSNISETAKQTVYIVYKLF